MATSLYNKDLPIDTEKGINVTQYGWNPEDIRGVTLIQDYVQQATVIRDEVLKVQADLQILVNDAQKVKDMYKYIEDAYVDFTAKYPQILDLYDKIVELQNTCIQQAGLASGSANSAASSASEALIHLNEIKTIQSDLDTKYLDIKAKHAEVTRMTSEVTKLTEESRQLVEELRKGQVYRGIWNPNTGSWPDPKGTNSVWDVNLNDGQKEFDWNAIKWLPGDRLIYTALTKVFDQIESGFGVLSINGKTGYVTITPQELGVLTSSEVDSKLTGYVPILRVVNGKPLTTDVTLNAADVGAISNSALLNGKPLVGNPSLTSSDVGAYPVTGGPLNGSIIFNQSSSEIIPRHVQSLNIEGGTHLMISSGRGNVSGSTYIGHNFKWDGGWSKYDKTAPSTMLELGGGGHISLLTSEAGQDSPIAIRHKIYTTFDKPSPLEIGASPRSGWGEDLPQHIGDCNLVKNSGIYEYNADSGDKNGAAYYGTVTVYAQASNSLTYSGWTHQVFRSIFGDTFTRSMTSANGATWSPWEKIYTSGNKPTPQDINAVLKRTRVDWADGGVLDAVVGQLAWNNYGNGHTIFDASAGFSPNGTVIDKMNASNAWSATYPTLMGWNGAGTYGVRVDSARIADSAADSVKKTGDIITGPLTINNTLVVDGVIHKKGGGDIIIGSQDRAPYREGQIYNIGGELTFRSDLNTGNDSLGGMRFSAANHNFVGGPIVATGTANPICTIGGSIRSNNTNVMSLDGRSYSFVTSPLDAHLCYNSYWDGANWLKYDNARNSGHVVTNATGLRYITSAAGQTNPTTNNYAIYHEGNKPTPSAIGAQSLADTRSNSMNNAQTTIPATESGDMNAQIAGYYGLYNGNAVTNSPYAGYFYAETKSIYANSALLQTAWPYDGNGSVFHRNYSLNTRSWTPWRSVYDTVNKPTPAAIGAMAVTPPAISIASATPSIELHKPGVIAAMYSIDANNRWALSQTGGNAVSYHTHSLVDLSTGQNYFNAQRWTNSRDHSYAGQWGQWSPLTVDFGAGAGSSDYYPVIKGRHVIGGQGYTTDVEFGMIRSGNTWGGAVIRVGSAESGTAGTMATYNFDIGGNFTASGDISGGTLKSGSGGVYTTGQLAINNNNPTLWLQDTDNRSAAIHNNSNLLYILRGQGNNATAWDGGPNGRHPMTLNLETGDVVFSGNVVAYSDRRLKRDIKPLENALEKVMKLEGVSYKRIGEDTDRLECGFVAQDLQEVIPEVVIEQQDEDKTLTVDYAKMNAYLVEAIKEQQRLIEELQIQVKELRGGE